MTGQLGAVARYWTLRLSPDGERALVNPDEYTWALDARTNARTRVAKTWGALWMPNGRDVIYPADRALWIGSSTGEGQPRKVYSFTDSLILFRMVTNDIAPELFRVEEEVTDCRGDIDRRPSSA